MAKQKTTTLDIYAKRQTKKQRQLEAERAAVAAARTATPKTTTTKTTTTPNPALAQAVVASVGNAGNARGLLSVGGAVARNAAKATTPTINIRSGATSTPGLRSAVKQGQTNEMATVEREPSTLERIGLSALGGVKDWASSYMDYAGVGASAEHTSGKDLTSSELARWQNEAAREQKVIDSYERGEGIYDKADYEIAKEQLATYQTYIDSYQKSVDAQAKVGEQTAAESSKLRQSAALDTLWATSGLGKVGTALVRGVGTTTQNALDLLMSGGASALPSIAARVYGQSTQEALDNGDSREKAVAVGLARAAAELIPEGLSGGNPLTDAGRGKSSLLRQTLDKLSSSKYVNNFVTKLGAGALGEGTEEVITQGLNDLISGIAYGKDATLSTPEEYAEAFWGGVIGSLYGNVINPRATLNNVRQDVDDIISRRGAAPSAAEADAAQGDITTGAQPVQADSGAFNTAEAQAEAQPEQRPRQTTLDIYQNRGTRQQNIDNAGQSAYTDISDNTVSGGAEGDTGAGAGRGLAENRDGVSDVYDKRDSNYQGQWRPSGLSVDSGFVLSEQAKSTIQSRGVAFVETRDVSADSAAFSSALDEARAANAKNVWVVSPKSAQDISENGVRIYMDENGSAGFGVAPDGDIEAVFANKSKGAPPHAAESLIPQAIAAGGSKLDCYGSGLVTLYSQYGFVPVARVVFDPEYANEGWDAGKGTPDIYFMMATDTDADSVVANGGSYPVPTQAELDALPLMEYDEAYAYRDRMLAERAAGSAAAEDVGLYGRSVGAATPRRGEQVASRNNLQHDANLSEEGRQAVADAGNTHERISNSLARSRAEANIARDGDGNWLNLQDCMDDLQATIEGGGVLTPEQVKLAEMVLVELDHIAREDGDRSAFNGFNRLVIQASKTAAGQSLNAWREFSNGYISTVDTATEIVEAARENPATNQNRKRTNREADEILRRVSNQVGEAADRTLMRIGLDERQADNIPKLRELITQSWQNKQRAYDDLMAYFVERYNMSEQEAGLAANNISTLFYGELAELSSEALHRKFDNKKRNQTDTTWIDKTVELINMGALTDADFRAVASEKLFGTRASDEVLSRISQYAEDAQELRDAGDVDGLRDHVVMLSTERGYKPSRGIQRILDQKTDVNDLYTLAQSLAVGIAVDQAKPSFGQKLSTWQYLSHLYNTGTIMRNFASNTVFAPIDRLSNTLAIVPDFFGAMIRSASEGGTVGQNRTVARQPWGFNRNVRQTRRAYVDEARIDNALDINRGAAQGKYTGQTQRLTNRTFDRKGNWWNRLNNFREGMLGVGLNVADAVQKGTTKGQSEAAMERLRQTGGVMTEEAAQAITESDMLYRSFQRDTPLGTLLSITREWLNTIGIGRTRGRYMDTHEFGVGSLVDTYTQVPGALLHTAADYTPLGIVNTALEIYNAIQFNRGQVDAMAEPGALSPQYKGMTNADASVVAQHNAALSVGRMATGGLIFGLFSFLAQVGAAAIRLYGDDDRDKDEALEAQGVGGFQFNQDAFIRGLMGENAAWQDGDIIHDLSQYPPVSTIAQLAVIYADDDNDDKFIRMLDATARSLAEQFGDLSMMSTAKTVYDDIQYRGDKNTWEVMGDIAGDLAGNAVTGMIPGTFRQLARTTDPYMRDTSADSVLGRAWNRFRSVTPGLRQTLPAKVDYKGEARQYTGNTLSRFLNAFVLPGNVTVYRQDDVVDYIDQLSEASGTSLYADAYAPKKLDYDGERYELDSDARRDYNEAYKSDYYDSMKTFMQSKYARAMSDDMAAEVASGLRGLAAYRAKREFFKTQGKTYAPDNDIYKRYDSIADPALYMAMREAVKALTASGGTDNKAFNAAYSQWRALSAAERAKYTDGVEGSFDGIDTLKKLDNCLQAGMSTEQFYAAKAEYKALGDDDSLNAGTRRAEFAYWLDTQSGFDSAARAAALENFKFTTTIVSDEGGYEKMTAAGVSKSSSERIYSAIQALTPEAGYTNVSDLQKCETITGSTISEKEKLAALKVYASEAQAKYYQAAYDNGIKLDTWSAVRRYMHQLNEGNGNDVSQTRLLLAMAKQGISKSKARAMFAVYYPDGNFDKAARNAF